MDMRRHLNATTFVAVLVAVILFEGGYWMGRGHGNRAGLAEGEARLAAALAAQPAPVVATPEATDDGAADEDFSDEDADDEDDDDGDGRRGPRSAAEMLARVDRLLAEPASPRRDERLTRELSRLARVDPRLALERASGIGGVKLRNDALERVIYSWGRSNPAEAWEWVKNSPNDGTLPSDRVDLLFAGLSRGKPEAALAFLSAHADELGPHRDHAVAALDEIYSRGGHDAMQSWIGTLPEGRMRDVAVNRFIDQWARYDPAAAKTWMENQNIPAANLGSARVELAESWARVRPQEAVAWVETLPEKERSRELYDAVFRRWIQYDRNGAAQWLADQPPSPTLDRPIERYTWQVMDLDPQNTMSWAETVTDKNRRFRLMTEVADRWGRRDPQGLANYVAGQNLPQEQRDRLLRSTQPKKQ